ncbi:type II secretion system minor pseudopilin GspI [Pseudomonas umsongensis]|uniref:type II secretion system minor pseudopilin GspI n=1 Tax=Pseudomonas umsongensis TaxID=198618 RepID=UPI0015BA08AD|nr:type II secretion system minor pseudopilin GspI [Pseudomonas umsongensis]NWL19565.1 type II secretion system protein GspI [Pseudomonas umsongensis]
MSEPPAIARMSGFTLLEVMVALAIFATLATAVLSASQYVVRQAGAAEERLLAAWVADNQLSELRLQSSPVLAQPQRMVSLGQRDWVVRQNVDPTRDPPGLLVEVEVGLAGRDQTLFRATGWIANRHE